MHAGLPGMCLVLFCARGSLKSRKIGAFACYGAGAFLKCACRQARGKVRRSKLVCRLDGKYSKGHLPAASLFACVSSLGRVKRKRVQILQWLRFHCGWFVNHGALNFFKNIMVAVCSALSRFLC